MVIGRKIGHGQSITPINFQVTRSKVKVTVPFNAKNLSAQYHEKVMSDSHGKISLAWSHFVRAPAGFYI